MVCVISLKSPYCTVSVYVAVMSIYYVMLLVYIIMVMFIDIIMVIFKKTEWEKTAKSVLLSCHQGKKCHSHTQAEGIIIGLGSQPLTVKSTPL